MNFKSLPTMFAVLLMLNLSKLLVAGVALVCVQSGDQVTGSSGGCWEARGSKWLTTARLILTHTHTHIHRVSSLYHKSLTTEPSSNRRRHIQSTFHLCCCCRAGHIYSSVRQYRKRRRGEVSGWLHNADTLLPPATAGTGLPTRHACCAAICGRDGRRRAKISAAVITEGDNFMGPALSY